MRIIDWFKKYCKDHKVSYNNGYMDSIEFWRDLTFKMDITEDMKFLNEMKNWSMFNRQAIFMYLVCTDKRIRITEFKRLALNKKQFEKKFKAYLLTNPTT